MQCMENSCMPTMLWDCRAMIHSSAANQFYYYRILKDFLNVSIKGFQYSVFYICQYYTRLECKMNVSQWRNNILHTVLNENSYNTAMLISTHLIVLFSIFHHRRISRVALTWAVNAREKSKHEPNRWQQWCSNLSRCLNAALNRHFP